MQRNDIGTTQQCGKEAEPQRHFATTRTEFPQVQSHTDVIKSGAHQVGPRILETTQLKDWLSIRVGTKQVCKAQLQVLPTKCGRLGTPRLNTDYFFCIVCINRSCREFSWSRHYYLVQKITNYYKRDGFG